MNQTGSGLTYSGKPRTCGLRFSFLDGIVLVATAILTVVTYVITAGFSLFALFVVLHFFLFCNVFRISRRSELIWAGVFLLNCLGWIALGNLNMLGIFSTQLLVTTLILGLELRSPRYHGICSRRVNPRIEEYLAGKI